jgi:hypothetical protein
MKQEVTIKYQDLSDTYLEMLIEILTEAGLDEKADEVKEFMHGVNEEEGWED